MTNVSWKAPSTRAAISSWSRPLTNNTVVTNPDWANANINGGQSTNITNYGSWNRTRPIKHWRKQLQPLNESGYSRSAVSIQDTPGSNVVIHTPCCSTNGSVIQMDISPTDHTTNNTSEKLLGPNYSTICFSCPTRIKPTAGLNTVPINSQNPSLIPPRQPYNFDTKSYLRSRNKSYTSNRNGNMKKGIQYATESPNSCCVVPLPYTNNNNGPQVRSSLNAIDVNDCKKCIDIIVKPNNQPFFQQGAVSSSERITRLKYNTIADNAASFKHVWGSSAATAANYYNNGNSPYFIKSKNNICNSSC